MIYVKPPEWNPPPEPEPEGAAIGEVIQGAGEGMVGGPIGGLLGADVVELNPLYVSPPQSAITSEGTEQQQPLIGGMLGSTPPATELPQKPLIRTDIVEIVSAPTELPQKPSLKTDTVEMVGGSNAILDAANSAAQGGLGSGILGGTLSGLGGGSAEGTGGVGGLYDLGNILGGTPAPAPTELPQKPLIRTDTVETVEGSNAILDNLASAPKLDPSELSAVGKEFPAVLVPPYAFHEPPSIAKTVENRSSATDFKENQIRKQLDDALKNKKP